MTYSVWTATYNKDGSVNNETLWGEYTDKAEALAKAKEVDGEVRQYINEADYDVIEV